MVSGIFIAPAALASVGLCAGSLTAKRVTPRLAKGVEQPLTGALRALIAFQCLMLAPIFVWARPITGLLLGSRYSQSAEVLRALAPFVFFAGLAPVVTRAVDDGAEVSRRVSICVGTVAFAVAAGLILIPRRGVVGGAIAIDIAFGFYTLAHIWVCRQRFNLRIGTLLWALASALTAAAAMGIVLTLVGTKHLTLTDWVRGCFGGLAAYVAMLIFTREITTTQIARATSVMTARLAPRATQLGSSVAPATNGHAYTQFGPVAQTGHPEVGDDAGAPRPLASVGAGAREPDVEESTGADVSELAYRRADKAGDAGAAFNLGVLLHQRREFAAAAAAYERAESRGDRDAAFNLGILLYELGDLDAAEATWRRCLRRRHAQAAANLGFLLRRRGDLDGARAVYAEAARWAETGGSAAASDPAAPRTSRPPNPAYRS